MGFNPKDHFFHKAKKDGFVARSAYKLQDLQKRFRVLAPNDRVLDLGCSPGSWSQVALKIIGAKGVLVGIDLKPVTIQKPPNATFIEGDILATDPQVFGEAFDCIISDMAPNTTGIRLTDQARSEELCRMCLSLANTHLKNGGNLVMKLFEGPDDKQLVTDTKSMFHRVERFKPEGVRKGSFETYIVGLKKKP